MIKLNGQNVIFIGTTRCTWRYILYYIKRNGSCNNSTTKFTRGEIHSDFGQRRLLWRKGATRVSKLIQIIFFVNYSLFYRQFTNWNVQNKRFANSFGFNINGQFQESNEYVWPLNLIDSLFSLSLSFLFVVMTCVQPILFAIQKMV